MTGPLIELVGDYLLVRRDSGIQRVTDFPRNPMLRLGAIRGFRYNPGGNRLVDELDAYSSAGYFLGHQTGG